MNTPPPSVQRRSIGRQHEREMRVLNNFAMMSAVRMGIVWMHSGDPNLDAWIEAATAQGWTVEPMSESTETCGFSYEGQLCFIGVDTTTGAVCGPVGSGG